MRTHARMHTLRRMSRNASSTSLASSSDGSDSASGEPIGGGVAVKKKADPAEVKAAQVHARAHMHLWPEPSRAQIIMEGSLTLL